MQDGPEYFAPPEGLITFEMDVQRLLKDAAPPGYERTDPVGPELQPFERHFQLVHYQLQQVCFACS